jgi:hypothetical protein
MDGATLYYDFAQACQEDPATSGFIEKRTAYTYLYIAACELARRTNALTSTQTITTVANQTYYDLNPDFYFQYLKTDLNEYYIVYNDGTADYYPTFRDYEATKYYPATAQPIPNNYSIRDKRTVETILSGTTTSAGTSTYVDESYLVCASQDFSGLWPGDVVHNTKDGSIGYVVGAGTASTSISTVLYGGTNNAWASSDTFVVVPQPRKQIILDPPPSVSGHTITLEYIQRPVGVYSAMRTYRFNPSYLHALIAYAVWKYKYKDRAPIHGDYWFKMWDSALRDIKQTEDRSLNRRSWKVNFRKRAYTDRSYR